MTLKSMFTTRNQLTARDAVALTEVHKNGETKQEIEKLYEIYDKIDTACRDGKREISVNFKDLSVVEIQRILFQLMCCDGYKCPQYSLNTFCYVNRQVGNCLELAIRREDDIAETEYTIKW